MGYPTKIQRIARKNSQQWFVHFPSAVAHALELTPGEVVEWVIEDKSQLVLRRIVAPPSVLKKKHRAISVKLLKTSGSRRVKPLRKSAPGGGEKR